MRIVTTSPREVTGGGKIGALFVLLFGVVIGGLIASCAITLGIWPGELKLLAPFFCTDAQPDAFVVSDTYSPQPGETVTNFTMYCMGPRGDATDVGFLKPFLAISIVNGLAIVVAVVGLGLLRRVLKRGRGGNRPSDDRPMIDFDGDGRPDGVMRGSSAVPFGPDSTPGPFVD